MHFEYCFCLELLQTVYEALSMVLKQKLKCPAGKILTRDLLVLVKRALAVTRG